MVDHTYTKVGSWIFNPLTCSHEFKECSNVVVSFPDADGFIKFKDFTNSMPLDFKSENKFTFDLLKPVYNGETTTNLDKVRGLIPCDGVDFGKGIMLDPKDKKRKPDPKKPYWESLPKRGKKGKDRKNWEL